MSCPQYRHWKWSSREVSADRALLEDLPGRDPGGGAVVGLGHGGMPPPKVRSDGAEGGLGFIRPTFSLEVDGCNDRREPVRCFRRAGRTDQASPLSFQLPGEETRAVFELDVAKFDELVQYRVYMLTNGVRVSAPFREIGDSVTIDEDGQGRTLTAKATRPGSGTAKADADIWSVVSRSRRRPLRLRSGRWGPLWRSPRCDHQVMNIADVGDVFERTRREGLRDQ